MLFVVRAEARSPEWWTRVTTTLARHGYRTKFIAVFLNSPDANFTVA
ncbi:MAG: hypothetical protein H0U36_09915 [Nocardioidaceae bacterium]|nr:hypothetical protein [Nocardioidaceae bacterium]